MGAIKFISDTKSIGEGKLYASPKSPQKYDYALVKVALNELDDDDDDRISLSDGRSIGSKRRKTTLLVDNHVLVADDTNNSTTTILVKLLLFLAYPNLKSKSGEMKKLICPVLFKNCIR